MPTDPQTAAAYAYDNLTSANAVCVVASGVRATYVLGATLEDSNNAALSADIDGTIGSVICADPVYCLQP